MCFLTEPSAPRSLVAASNDTSVTLSRMAPDTPNGIITQYEVQRRRTYSGNNFGNSGVTTVPTYRVTGLNTGTQYDFRVRAFNRAGHGPFSDAITVLVGKLSMHILT